MKSVVLLALISLAAIPSLLGQAPDSSARARALLDQAIAALGGEAFLHLKTQKTEGRVYLFRRNALAGFTTVTEYVLYPDQERREYGKEQDEAEIVSGNKGWKISPHGVLPFPLREVQRHRQQQSMSAFRILRYRLREEGSILEYAGRDLLNNRQVDLVNFIDRDNRTASIALDSSTHLPLQVLRATRDPQNGQRIEDREILSNYSEKQGITAPRHILRMEGGTKVFESFIRDVQYNEELSDLLFIPPVILPSAE